MKFSIKSKPLIDLMAKKSRSQFILKFARVHLKSTYTVQLNLIAASFIIAASARSIIEMVLSKKSGLAVA